MAVSLEEALKEALEHPGDYFGEIPNLQDEGWAITFSRSRDSDNREIANYEHVLSYLYEKYPDEYRVAHSSHWAVGWVDQILVKAVVNGEITQVFKDMYEFALDLEQYPALDEDAEIRMDHEDLLRWIEQESWYAWRQIDEDADCPEIDPQKVAEYLFDTFSISHVDDVGDMSQLVEAVKYVTKS